LIGLREALMFVEGDGLVAHQFFDLLMSLVNVGEIAIRGNADGVSGP